MATRTPAPVIKISHFKEELNRTIEWLKFAEQKLTLLGAYYGLGTTFLVTNIDKITKSFKTPVYDFGYIFKWLMLLCFIISMFLGIYFLLKVVFPKLDNPSTNKSLFYYKHISEMKLIDFMREVRQLTDTDIENQLLEQIHTNATISNIKMTNIKYSSICLFSNLGFLFILIFII